MLLAQTRMGRDDRFVILIDAAEDKQIRRRHVVHIIEPHIEQTQLVFFRLFDVGGQRVRPDRHKHRAVLLGFRQKSVRRMNERDPFEGSLSHDWVTRISRLSFFERRKCGLATRILA